jgi:hypothetical protein
LGGRYEATVCACLFRANGSAVGSIIWEIGQFSRFFNPRTDLWWQHFRLDGVGITARSDVGYVTVQILDLLTAA